MLPRATFGVSLFLLLATLLLGCGGKKLGGVDAGNQPDANKPDVVAEVGVDIASEVDAGQDVGAKDTPGPQTAAPLPVEQYAADVLRAGCSFYARCGLSPDVESCLAAYPPDAISRTLLADVESGLIIYDGTRARGCIDWADRQPCKYTEAFAQAAEPFACDGLFTGTIPVNGRCYFKDECVPGSDCLVIGGCDQACCVGQCVSNAGLGASCEERLCAPTLYCDPETFDCRPQASVEGSVCTTGDGCAPPLFCVADATGISGTCEKKLPSTGAFCDQVNGCDDYRDVCNASNVCVRRTGLGKPCTTQPDNCVYYGWCDGTVCRALGGEGESCEYPPDTGASDCQGFLSCTRPTMKCLAPPPPSSCR